MTYQEGQSPPCVLMLLGNSWENDSRVIREANALTEAGFKVHVLALGTEHEDSTKTLTGVIYHNIHAIRPIERALEVPKAIWIHLRVILHASGSFLRDNSYLGAVITALGGLVDVAIILVLSPLMILTNVPRLLLPKKSRIANACRILFGAMLRWTRLDIFLHANQFAAHAIGYAKSAKPHIVHAHDFVTLSAGFALTKGTKIPLVYDAHELETGTNYPDISGRMQSWIMFYEKNISRSCAAVITVCESIADWLSDHYRMRRPIVVHNSPDLKAMDVSAKEQCDTLRQHLKLSLDCPLAVYVGSITIDRGLENCVRALAYDASLHFACVGPAYSLMVQQLMVIAESLGVIDRFHLVDAVPSNDVPRFISDADCSVIAIQNVCLSYYYCFPNKLLESVFAGLPVVAARLVELEKFIAKYKVGIIADETDPEALAVAMRKVIEDRAAFKATPKMLDEIAEIYSWETQRKKLIDLYLHLIPGAFLLQVSSISRS